MSCGQFGRKSGGHLARNLSPRRRYLRCFLVPGVNVPKTGLVVLMVKHRNTTAWLVSRYQVDQRTKREMALKTSMRQGH